MRRPRPYGPRPVALPGRLRGTRPAAEATIPVYLLIDRDHSTVTVFSDPKDGQYQQTLSRPWGAPVELPAPVGFTLDTEKLKDYAA